MRTYERPTLTAAGSFKKLTGLSGHGPRDVLLKHQLL
ncbi:MAG TPA: keywimysin-related RiPP [Actinomycetota bacterium]|nr:keywimysin-related RiPP [Actinomycetota bacterium]